jgi:hypothetical protein
MRSTTLVASAASLAASASSLHGVILVTQANFTATIGGSPNTVFFDLAQTGAGPHFGASLTEVPNANFSLYFAENTLDKPIISDLDRRSPYSHIALTGLRASRLDAGEAIDSSLTFSHPDDGYTILLAGGNTGPWGISGGDSISGYLGLAIETGSDWNFGWAGVEWYRGTDINDDPSTLTLNRFAFETQANTPIEAGAIPEPATAGLFAALAAGAGALALRRRRAA